MDYSPKLAVVFLFALASTTIMVTAQNSDQDVLDAHNLARADLGVGPAYWDPDVAAYAEAYAEQRRADCLLIHSGGGVYGENLFWGDASIQYTRAEIVRTWVAEKQYYDPASNSCFAPPGQTCEHYTQVVWRASTAIGCAAVNCDNGTGKFMVCNYSPPGNIPGQTPY